jgi:outer membrane receptor protein involved in Fe transport
MLNKNYLFLTAVLSVGLLYADNPGEDVASAPEAVEALEAEAVASEEQVVSEASVSTESSSEEGVQELGRVAVTGSRIKRVDVEGATPLITITRSDIEAQGFQTVYDAVSNLSQNTGSIIGENFQAGFSKATQTINLRDFGPGRTLVLVNGKRTADYPFPYNGESASFNYAAIPLAAVDRIEVLTSGASSIYGSDAVAGVVNIILVDGLEDKTFRAQVGGGVGAGTGGETVNFEFAGGGFTDRLSYTYALEYRDEQPIPIQSRSEHDSFEDSSRSVPIPSRGFLIRDTFYYGLHYNPEIGSLGTLYDWNTPAGPAPLDLACTEIDPEYTLATPEQHSAYARTYYGTYCGLDTSSNGTLTNERKRASVYLSGTYELTDRVEVYAKLVHLETDTAGTLDNLFTPFVYVSGPQPIGGIYSEAGDAFHIVPAGQPNAGAGASMMDVRIQKIFSNAVRGTSFEEETTTFDIGARGVLANGYEWDVSYTDNTYETVSTGRNFLASALFDKIHNIGGVDGAGNPCVLDQGDLLDGDPSNGEVTDYGGDNFALGYQSSITSGYTFSGFYDYGAYWGQPNCYNWDWFLSNPSAEEIESLRVDNIQPADSFSELFQASITGDIMQLPYGPLGFAAVVEHQTKGYDVQLSPLNKEGKLWGIGGVDGGGERDRTAFGIEFSIPVTETFLVNVSTRMDEYDSSKANVDRRTSGASFEWRPRDNFLLRGSWSESFKAPDLPYSFVGERRFYDSQIDFYQCYASGDWGVSGEGCGVASPGYGIINIDGVTVGNLNLKEEEGDSYSIGFVWEPADRLILTLDAFHIQLMDIVSTKNLSTIVRDEAICRAQEAGDFSAGNVTYPDSYCSQVYDSIVRGGKDFTEAQGYVNVLPEGSITKLYETPVNIAGQEFIGVDTSISYSWVTDSLGDFSFSIVNTNQIDLKYAEDIGDPLISYMNSSYVPRSRQSLRLGWTRGDWSASMSTLRIGHMEGDDGETKRPYFDTNVAVAYDITPESFVSLTVTNVFDSIPDTDIAYDQASSFYPFGFNSFAYPRFGPQAFLTYQIRF